MNKAILHKRHSVRLKGYDYSSEGAYFVTICVQDRKFTLGHIIDGNAISSAPGRMVEKWWNKIPSKFPDIKLDALIVMPNHVHGVLFVGADQRVCPDIKQPRSKMGEHSGSPLPDVIQWFKTMSTNEYIRGVKESNWPAFRQRFWQRNYYEHIIRDEYDLNSIREYIVNNPLKWEFDKENPDHIPVAVAGPSRPINKAGEPGVLC
jgi:putative transposase